MASIDSVQAGSGFTAPASSGSASAAIGELAKCESQLSDWVNCPSSKTSAGKAKIAEITSKIDAIKAQMKKAEEAKADASAVPPALKVEATRQLRLDGLGSWLSTQA